MTLTYALLGVIFIVVGFVGGALVTMLWIEKEKRSSSDKKQANTSRPDHSIYLRQYGEELDLWLGGKPQREASSLNPAQRQAAMNLFEQYKKWLDIEDEPAAVEIRLPTVSNHVPSASHERVSTLSSQVVKPVNTPIESEPTSGIKSTDTPVAVSKPSLSMVEQINNIVQEKLVQNSMSERGIRLGEDLIHGVVVWIGLKKYFSLDELPDEQVKELIRSAVSEWEHGSNASK